MSEGKKIAGLMMVLATVLCGPTLLFSQDPGAPPKQAARTYSPLGDLSGDPSQIDSQTITPDNRPLTGAQTTTLGSPEMRHSYWIPGFEYGNFIQSSSNVNPAVSAWNSTSYVGGNFSLSEAWRHAQLYLNCSGGGFFSTDDSVGNGDYHQAGLVQQFEWRGWQLSFLDQYAYLPQAQFGFGAGTNLSLAGIGGTLGTPAPGMQSNYLPSQSIYSALGPRYSNAFVTQIGYRVDRRTSLIFAGSYGILRFTQPGNVDTNDAIFSAGYEYEVSRNSTLGVVYRFTIYNFDGQPQAIRDHTAQLAYGRKITGRIALELFGGPEITQLRVPIGTSNQHISGAGSANLVYTFTERTDLSGSYTHGISGGSGVFTGATSDQVQSSLNHQINRHWRGGIHFGYSRNGTIAQSGAQNAPRYNTWYAGAGLERALGPYAHFNLSYTAYLEDSNQIIAPIGTPFTSYAQHQIKIEFGWHTRPLVTR